MQDRVSLYPGRVKLEPVAGQANTYDLTRADQPTQEGTPLNKASLLKDATAALFGLTTDAVPDDVLALIKTLIDNANDNANTKAQYEIGTYIGTGGYKTGSGPQLTFSIKPKLLIIVKIQIDSYYVSAYQPIFINLEATKYAKDKGLETYGSYGYLLISLQGYAAQDSPSDWYADALTDNSIQWFMQSGDAKKAYNESGKTYHYIAIG